MDTNIEYVSTKEKAQAMYQNAVTYVVHHHRFQGRKTPIVFLAEGPYAIPFLRK